MPRTVASQPLPIPRTALPRAGAGEVTLCPLSGVSNEQTVPGKRYISGETFHTDHSNHPTPPKATMLFPVSLPSRGGDTQYVNMHAAYDDLSAATKERIDGLKALHVYLRV